MHDKMKTEICRLAVRVYLAFMPSCTHLPLHVKNTHTKNIYNDPGHEHMNCTSAITTSGRCQVNYFL